MNGGVLIPQSVVEIDDDAVALVDFDSRKRPFTVDANNFTRILVRRVGRDPGHSPIEFDGSSVYAGKGKGRRRRKERGELHFKMLYVKQREI